MIQVFIRSITWTLINIGVILVIKHGDNSGWNETMLLILLILAGMINCAILFYSFYRLRTFSKEQVIYSIFGILNAFLCLATWNDLQILAGTM